MSNRPLRFIHAADFHLEQPPSGIAAVPDALRELFLESAWLAAEKVFEVVLSEEAEFLVLCGDLLSPLKTGPRGPLFLSEQFERLAQRAIPVYWAAGRVDPPELWPSAVPLPKNVHVFPVGRPEAINYDRDGVPAVRLVGASRLRGRKMCASEFEPDPAGLFTIAAVHGSVASESLRAPTSITGPWAETIRATRCSPPPTRPIIRERPKGAGPINAVRTAARSFKLMRIASFAPR